MLNFLPIAALDPIGDRRSHLADTHQRVDPGGQCFQTEFAVLLNCGLAELCHPPEHCEPPAPTGHPHQCQHSGAHRIGVRIVAVIDEITARSMPHETVVSHALEPELTFEVALLRVESEPLSIVTQRFVDHLATELNAFLASAAP